MKHQILTFISLITVFILHKNTKLLKNISPKIYPLTAIFNILLINISKYYYSIDVISYDFISAISSVLFSLFFTSIVIFLKRKSQHKQEAFFKKEEQTASLVKSRKAPISQLTKTSEQTTISTSQLLTDNKNESGEQFEIEQQTSVMQKKEVPLNNVEYKPNSFVIKDEITADIFDPSFLMPPIVKNSIFDKFEKETAEVKEIVFKIEENYNQKFNKLIDDYERKIHKMEAQRDEEEERKIGNEILLYKENVNSQIAEFLKSNEKVVSIEKKVDVINQEMELLVQDTQNFIDKITKMIEIATIKKN